ncbi:hypothetical protein E4U57_006887 [Claviceps arundinis]|uniref:Uncharacterized protein n=1 Tax=Claviceps arundinis TaxID=1623583 RepID=A0ABQ7PG33_9HYPO|nr:hypothetical protein E4U57_006887 [Claviceps arundinis]
MASPIGFKSSCRTTSSRGKLSNELPLPSWTNGGACVVPGKAVDVSTYPASGEKVVPTRSDDVAVNDDEERVSDDEDRLDSVIVTGYDAAQYLLSLRDDFEPALTFRSIVVASAWNAARAVMSHSARLYSVSKTCRGLGDGSFFPQEWPVGTSSLDAGRCKDRSNTGWPKKLIAGKSPLSNLDLSDTNILAGLRALFELPVQLR